MRKELVMTNEDLIKLGEEVTKKWNEQNPDTKMPEVDSTEFNVFCNDLFDKIKNEPTTFEEVEIDSEDISKQQDDINLNYFYKEANDWVNNNPGKTLGLIFLASTVLLYKVFQHVCTQAVYKGNIRTYKYLSKFH